MPEFSDPGDVRDFEEVMHEFLRGELPARLVYKSNISGLGNGNFFLTREDSGRIRLTFSDDEDLAQDLTEAGINNFRI